MIEWNIDPELISFGPVSIRWYGLFFVTAFLAGLQFMTTVFRYEKKKEDDLNSLLIYMVISIIVGARLGHCLFYDPGFYLSNPTEILKIWKGGLASHGASIGILAAIYLFIKNFPGYTFLWIMDRLVITVAFGGALVRLGNLFNSEIIGKAANIPWAFVFLKVDNVPRHPAQLYESIGYFILFGILFYLYMKKKEKVVPGSLFGIFLIILFGFRFLIEYFKEVQEPFEQSMIINMGQILSLPFILGGIYLTYKAYSGKTIQATTDKKKNGKNK